MKTFLLGIYDLFIKYVMTNHKLTLVVLFVDIYDFQDYTTKRLISMHLVLYSGIYVVAELRDPKTSTAAHSQSYR